MDSVGVARRAWRMRACALVAVAWVAGFMTLATACVDVPRPYDIAMTDAAETSDIGDVGGPADPAVQVAIGALLPISRIVISRFAPS